MLAAHEMTSSLSPICADNSRPPVPYYPNAINSYYSEQAYKDREEKAVSEDPYAYRTQYAPHVDAAATTTTNLVSYPPTQSFTARHADNIDPRSHHTQYSERYQSEYSLHYKLPPQGTPSVTTTRMQAPKQQQIQIPIQLSSDYVATQTYRTLTNPLAKQLSFVADLKSRSSDAAWADDKPLTARLMVTPPDADVSIARHRSLGKASSRYHPELTLAYSGQPSDTSYNAQSLAYLREL